MKQLLSIISIILTFGNISAQNTPNKKDAIGKSQTFSYQGEVAAAYGFGFDDASTVLLETVHGLRFNPYLFTGMGIGLNFYDGFGLLTPVINIKGHYPATRKIDLYFSLDMGTALGIADWSGETDFYTCIGPGFNFGSCKELRGDFSIRLQRIGTHGNTLLFRIGIIF